MRVVQQPELGRWLVGRLSGWGTVGSVAGTGFEAYARILHPITGYRRDLAVLDEWDRHPVVEERDWRWAAVAARTGHVMHPLVQWLRLTNNEDSLDFADGWSLGQSRTGWLDPVQLAELTGHLRSATATPSAIVLGVWPGWNKGGGARYVIFAVEEADDAELQRARQLEERHQAELQVSFAAFAAAESAGAMLKTPGREYVLLQASLDELADPDWGYSAGIGWSPGDNHPSPQLIWPDDRSWIVATEIDWDSTIVAGPRSLIDAILADQTFEAFEVRDTDDLGLAGDTVNPTGSE